MNGLTLLTFASSGKGKVVEAAIPWVRRLLCNLFGYQGETASGLIANIELCREESCHAQSELQCSIATFNVKCEFAIDLHDFFVRTVVKWVGHCFRHPAHPITNLLSLR